MINQKKRKNACIYDLDFKANDKWYTGKTFFPTHWHGKEVMSIVMEAYHGFKIKGAQSYILEPNGKYKIDSLLNNNIQIRMYSTKKGSITSAYPLLEKI